MNDMTMSDLRPVDASGGDVPSWCDLYLAGFSGVGAARMRGTSGAAACKWAARFGLSWQTPLSERVAPIEPEKTARGTDWAALHAQGLTLAEAASAAGKSHGAAWFWAASNKVRWAGAPQNSTKRKITRADEIARSLPPPDDADIDPMGCRRLWSAVLWHEWNTLFAVAREFPRKPSRERHVVDARHRQHLDQQEASVARARAYERDKARRWFGTEDFRIVCALAGVDADFVMMRFRAALAARVDLAAEGVQG